MPRTWTLQAYRARLKKLNKDLKKAAASGPRQAAKFMQNEARRTAPVWSGETRRGIRIKPLKTTRGTKGWEVVSIVSGPYLQNLWTNRTAPYRQNKRMGVYGAGGHRRVSGTPRWFHFATIRARDRYVNVMRRKVKGALQAGFLR